MAQIYERMVDHIVKSWKWITDAKNIAQWIMEKKWYFKPWTQTLTTSGKIRNALTAKERALSRSITQWHTEKEYKFVNWRYILKSKPRKLTLWAIKSPT